MKDYSFQTRAVRGGHQRSPEGEQAEPIFATSSFVFDSAKQAAARFAETEPGNIYSRFTNPTVRIFQERLALLDGGEACMATASGMGAILATCLALLGPQYPDKSIGRRQKSLFCFRGATCALS